MANRKDTSVIPVLGEQPMAEAGVFRRMFYKIKKDPAVFIGMGGWTALVGYGLYNIRKRKTSLPLYLIHLRVTAQVFAIGCMVSVVGYRIFLHEKKKFATKTDDEK